MKEKKCKICKSTFVQYRTTQTVCSPSCALELSKQVKLKEWNKRKKELKDKAKTVQELLKETQIVFNKYIRLRDKGKPCISCGNDKPKKVNAGHFFSSGGHKAVTFDEDNVHLQCEYCNSFLSGNLIEYRKRLIELIGEQRYNELEKRAQNVRKYTRNELEEIKEHYKQKIKEIN